MVLTEHILKKVKEIADGMEFGSITINISGDSKTVDIITNKRERVEQFPKTKGKMRHG